MKLLHVRPTAARRARGQTRAVGRQATHTETTGCPPGSQNQEDGPHARLDVEKAGPSCVAAGDTKWRSRPRDGGSWQVKLPVTV